VTDTRLKLPLLLLGHVLSRGVADHRHDPGYLAMDKQRDLPRIGVDLPSAESGHVFGEQSLARSEHLAVLIEHPPREEGEHLGNMTAGQIRDLDPQGPGPLPGTRADISDAETGIHHVDCIGDGAQGRSEQLLGRVE